MIEQEVKLRFPHIEAARQAIVEAGGRLAVSRRLVEDRLFDLPEGRLSRMGMTLRTRRAGADGYLTVKGPILAGPVKTREELETRVGDPDVLEAALRLMGYVQTFRAQKFREEYLLEVARLTIDEVPFGVFVEIEGTPDGIARIAGALGRGAADYCLDSYPALWRQWCASTGRPDGDMLFAATGA